jgi:glycosyltransferase involved in cell wall biosynthesis
MRILQVHKYYYLRSGAERYLFNLARLLEFQGHSTAIFAMHHPCNSPARYSDHFVPQVDYRTLGSLGKVQAALRAVWYPAAARQIGRLIDAFHPDIVHLHNAYHQISPSILPTIRKRSIPIVQTLHDYKLVCPNYLLLTQSQVCERCQDRKYHHAIQNRCLHGSRTWSIVAAAAMTLHKRWQIYERHVERFIAPSRFLLDRMVDFGVPEHQLIHIPYFVSAGDWKPTPAGEGEYVLFIGRLSKEKGLLTLLNAVRGTDIPLLVVGEGPMRTRMEENIARAGLPNVRLTGYLNGQALAKVIEGARCTVVPSEWYEVFGQVITESFAQGKPVVATDIGGIPEIIDDGVDGLLVPPGDARALASALHRLWKRPQVATEMGQAGRIKVEERYDAPLHYQRIMALYQEAINQASN